MYKMVVRKESAIFFYPDRNFLHIQPYRQDWKLSHNPVNLNVSSLAYPKGSL